MDKETSNVLEIHKYIKTKTNVSHVSKVYSVFRADVIYEDPIYGDSFLKDVELRWQHSFINDISIPELTPPYYGDFDCCFQVFKNTNDRLVITGAHNDDPSVRYRVTLR